jgi:hypothetical protein
MALTQFMADGNEVYVKVKRTSENMPFAHVQYHVSRWQQRGFVNKANLDKDANAAKKVLETKNRQLLWGRQLRIEPACATRKCCDIFQGGAANTFMKASCL